MSWNYRIIRHPDPDGYLAVHEVFYRDDGAPHSWTENPISFACGLDKGPEGIVWALEAALKNAKEKPILNIPTDAEIAAAQLALERGDAPGSFATVTELVARLNPSDNAPAEPKPDWASFFARDHGIAADWVLERDQFGVGEAEARILAAYATATGRTQIDVLRECIRALAHLKKQDADKPLPDR